MRDVWRAAYMKLGHLLTRIPCTCTVDPKTRLILECGRCLAIHRHHDVKWEAEKRKPRHGK